MKIVDRSPPSPGAFRNYHYENLEILTENLQFTAIPQTIPKQNSIFHKSFHWLFLCITITYNLEDE